MRYISTRGQCPPVTFMEALSQGLALDGGLYMPERLPDLSAQIRYWEPLPYIDLAEVFLAHFITDISKTQLRERLEAAYASFTHPEITPLKGLGDRVFLLELFHGPTLAFKDLALQALGQFYELQIERTGEPINILGATSGDTGAAAIHGLLGKKGIRIFILYPEGRIAPLQERQMACVQADNVYPIAIKGTYDDAHRIVKTLFADQTFHTQTRLSAVNSINVARLLFQAVYFLYAYFRLPLAAREKVECVVPSGNFGNVLAGSWVKQMGLPLHSLRVATNQNDILYRFFKTGHYQPGIVNPSIAPSMDIQMPSNFERFLFAHEEGKSNRVLSLLEAIKKEGACTLAPFKPDPFTTTSATDAEILHLIRNVYERYRVVIDTHTACGFKDIDSSKTSICFATAHPAKFPDAVKKALGFAPEEASLETLWNKPMKRTVLPADEEAVREFILSAIA